MDFDLNNWPLLVRPALLSALTLAVAFVIGQIGRHFVRRRIGALASRTATDWDDAAVTAVARRIPFWALLAGLSVAAGFWPLPGRLGLTINTLLFVVATASATRLAADIAIALTRAYKQVVDPSLSGTSLIENLTRILVIGVGALIALNGLGVSITPILGALGVGGLAVALALQDTLANLFAGFYMTLAQQIRVGHYIRLASGEEGYVADIDWRATRLRMLSNNMVLVPNATLSKATVINYHLPDREMAVLVDLSVEYGSDLDAVERITLEVARDVMRTVPGAVATAEPGLRFHAVAEAAVHFTVILRVAEFVEQHRTRHEFVKRLHQRYRAEGIAVPPTMRTVLARENRVS